jgi:hypothetical protein
MCGFSHRSSASKNSTSNCCAHLHTFYACPLSYILTLHPVFLRLRVASAVAAQPPVIRKTTVYLLARTSFLNRIHICMFNFNSRRVSESLTSLPQANIAQRQAFSSGAL